MMSAAVRSVVLGAFSRPLYTLFANGEDGFLFGNWSELDELFTTSTGPTAVAADNDPVGLALDDRAWGGNTLAQVVAAQSELVPNPGGPFTSTTDWTPESNAVLSVSGGELVIAATSSAGSQGIFANLAVGAGKTYQCTFTLRAKAGNAQGARLRLLDVSAGAFKESYTVAAGQSLTQTFIFVAASSNYRVSVAPASIAAFGAVGDEAYLSSVSIKEIPGNHALQATTTQRPLWRANSGKPYLSFDGSDDNLLSRYAPGPVGCLAFAGVCSGNSRMALGGGLSPARLYFGLNAAGALSAGVGNDSWSIHSDNVSRSGVTGVGLLTYDGSTVRLYWDGALIYSGAQSGAAGATPIRLGAGGAPASFFWSGAIYAALAMNRVPSAPEIALITSQFQRTYQ